MEPEETPVVEETTPVALPKRAALSSAQRTQLKGLAHPLKPVVQVGQQGISTQVIAAVRQALLDHELVKVRLSRPPNKAAMGEELAGMADAYMVDLLGHTVILYKAHPKEPKIVLTGSSLEKKKKKLANKLKKKTKKAPQKASNKTRR